MCSKREIASPVLQLHAFIDSKALSLHPFYTSCIAAALHLCLLPGIPSAAFMLCSTQVSTAVTCSV